MSAAPTIRANPLDTALRLLSMGLSVIPLRARDKRPTEHWEEFQRRKASEHEIRDWFTGHPDLNIGIVTGAISGVVVVDADSSEALTWMQANRPSPMRTKTGRGKHHWFRHPGTAIRNSAKLLGMALDVRGDGGYVVAPGSIHPNGEIYLEDGTWDISVLPVFEPAWIGDAKTKPTQPKIKAFNGTSDRDKRVQAYLNRVEPAVEGNGGDAHTFRVACKLMRGFALSEDEAMAFLGEWNARCLPPWTEADLITKLRSALKSGTQPMGYLLSERPIFQHWTPPPMPALGTSVDAGGAGSLSDLLRKNTKGKILATPGNLYKILRHDPEFGPRLALNTMSQDIHFDGELVSDSFVDWVQEHLEDRFDGARWGREDVGAKIRATAELNPFHPIRLWLESLPPWDGIERLLKVATEILHANDQPLAGTYIRATFIAGARRVLSPGCKVDTQLVLVGPQGWGKSTFFRIMAGDQWFGDSPLDLESKEAFQVLSRKWITEISEIDHYTSTRPAERLKSFTSSPEDTYRPPYGKTVQVYPRSSIIVGTTNRDGFLSDSTGSRRFWPIKLSAPVDLARLTAWREQLWAEALDYCRTGAPHWLDAGQDQARELASSQFEAEDPWEGLVDLALAAMVQANRSVSDGVGTSDLLTFMNVPTSQQTRSASMKLAEILKRRGWVRQFPKDLTGKTRRLWYPT